MSSIKHTFLDSLANLRFHCKSQPPEIALVIQDAEFQVYFTGRIDWLLKHLGFLYLPITRGINLSDQSIFLHKRRLTFSLRVLKAMGVMSSIVIDADGSIL